mgnify:FL=1
MLMSNTARTIRTYTNVWTGVDNDGTLLMYAHYPDELFKKFVDLYRNSYNPTQEKLQTITNHILKT